MRDQDTKIAESDYGNNNPFVMIIKNDNGELDVFANGGIESSSGSVDNRTYQRREYHWKSILSYVPFGC